MAIDLKAVFEVQDRGSAKLRRIMKQTEQLDKTTQRLSRNNQRLQSSNRRLGSSFGGMSGMLNNFKGGLGGVAKVATSVVSALNPMGIAFAGVGAAAASAYGAVKVFNATVGKAMQAEVGEISIGSMFDTQKQTDAYLKMIKKMALDSPVLNYQEMSGGSKRLLTLTRDAKVLEKTWKNVEKLQAYMPEKSTDDAIRGISELASGDIVSLRDVFNLDKKQLNALKGLSFDEQVNGLEKMLAGMKITDKFIAKIGNTTYAKWNQVKEKFDDILTTIGKPSLEALSTFLNNVLNRLEGGDMARFAEWGGKVVNSMLTGLSNNAIKLYDYFTSLINDPEFQKLTTLSAKVDFIITDIADKLQAWYDGGGKEKLESFASVAVDAIVGALNASAAFAEVGAQMGASVWQGVVSGVKASATQNPLGKVLQGLYYTSPVGIVTESYNRFLGKDKGGKKSSHYHGLDSVPYDGYSASLHKNERILTAQENKEYTAAKEGKGGGFGSGVTITGNNFTIREEADIEKVAYKLALLIEKEATQIG